MQDLEKSKGAMRCQSSNAQSQAGRNFFLLEKKKLRAGSGTSTHVASGISYQYIRPERLGRGKMIFHREVTADRVLHAIERTQNVVNFEIRKRG